jgi:dTDP-D-glucose 4,6-dehydratase
MDMTPGLQRYAYMYVKDLAKIVVQIVETTIKSDIYNLSSSNSIELKKLVEKIIAIVKPADPQINFGAIPYRENQPMVIQGNIEKLKNELGELIETDFDSNFEGVVNYIIKN